MSGSEFRETRSPEGQILVVDEEHAVPFSKGLLAQSLTATGLSPDRAYTVAREVELRVLSEGSSRVTVDDLHALVGHVLGESQGDLYFQRYVKWQRLALQDRPVIILIGGATGVGKSTIATQLAHRLGIVRIISTDSVRQVMRAFFSDRLMPALHTSSFDAGSAVRQPVAEDADPLVVGFVEQARMVTTGLEALIERAINEATSMVLEGVHLVPGFLSPERWSEALVLPMVVVVRDEGLHRSHFLVRDRETNGSRPLQRYVEHIKQIRLVQEFILAKAEAKGTLIVENVAIDETVGRVVDALYERIEKIEYEDGAYGGSETVRRLAAS